MFSDLIDCLNKNGYNIITQIKDLLNSLCSGINSSVFDFTKIKEKIYGSTASKMPKSVNGMFFSKKNELLLIQTQLTYSAYDNLKDKTFSEMFLNDKIHEKVSGSIQTLSEIVSRHNLSKDFSTFFSLKDRSKIKTIVLVPISDQRYVRLTFGMFDVLKSFNPITSNIELMSCDEFEKNFS